MFRQASSFASGAEMPRIDPRASQMNGRFSGSFLPSRMYACAHEALEAKGKDLGLN